MLLQEILCQNITLYALNSTNSVIKLKSINCSDKMQEHIH